MRQSSSDDKAQSESGNGGQSLIKSGGIVGLMTFLSRILGFVRDQVLAISFGAGGLTDVFLVAFKIPNFLRRLFAEGAFAQAFVPVFAEYRETRDSRALVDLAAHVSGTLILLLLVVTTLGVALAPGIVWVFAPGFGDEPERYELAVQMLRITFPYLFFVSLLAYAGSILNTFGKFALPSFAPVLLNVSMIAAALWLAPQLEVPIKALAWGVFFAGALQLALLTPALARMGLLPRPRWGWRHSGVRRVLKLMAPAVLGSSVAQINLLLDTIIASFLVAGSLSWLYYSDRLMEFPLGLLGVTLGTIILPRLASVHASNVTVSARFSDTLDWAIRLAVLVGLPAALTLGLFALPMIVTLFGYGEFTESDARASAASLAAYALGLPAFLLVKVLVPGFTARQNMRTPVRIGIICLIANMAFNLAIVLPMIWLHAPYPHVGLALASSASGWLQVALLYRRLHREGVYRVGPELRRTLCQAGLAFVITALAGLWLAGGDWFSRDAMHRVWALAGILGAAGALYGASLFLVGLRPSHLKSP